MPLSFSACWAWRTSEPPADCDEADCCAPDCVALVALGSACDDEDDLSLARTAVLESASAAMTACASFMVVFLSGTGGTGLQRCNVLPALTTRGRVEAAR